MNRYVQVVEMLPKASHLGGGWEASQKIEGAKQSCGLRRATEVDHLVGTFIN